jgi:exosortase O
MGLHVHSTEGILLLENGVAEVGAPCSGIRSLWFGWLFLLATAALQGRRIDLRFGIRALVFGILLIAANVIRIFAVVLVGTALELPRIAELIHVPLGVLGFAGASSVLFLFAPPAQARPSPRKASSPRWLAPASGVVLSLSLALAAWVRPAPIARTPEDPPAFFTPPLGWTTTPLPLSPAETALLGRHQAVGATKIAFVAGDARGQLLVVDSLSWRAQHPPERCFIGSGLALRGLGLIQSSELEARWLELEGPDGGKHRAAYWYESPSGSTADLAARMWAEISGRERRWALVSVYFEDPLTKQSAAPLLDSVHRSLLAKFGGPS